MLFPSSSTSAVTTGSTRRRQDQVYPSAVADGGLQGVLPGHRGQPLLQAAAPAQCGVMRAAAHTPAYTTPNLHHHELQFLLCGEHTSDSSLLWLPNQHPAPLRVRDTATPAAACTAGLETRTRSSLAITRTGISRPSMMVISSLVPYIYVQLLQVFIPLIYDTKVQIQSCIVTRLLVFIHECLSAYRDNAPILLGIQKVLECNEEWKL